MPPRRALKAPLALVALVLLALAPAPAEAAELDALSEAYEAVAGQASPEAYAAQRATLEQMADHKSGQAQARLKALLARFGVGDPMRSVQLLGAIVRRGAPEDVDHVIRWVERRRDDILIDLLPAILTRIETPATQRYLRGGALRRATPPIKVALVRAIAEQGDPGGVMPLLQLIAEDLVDVRTASIEALGILGDKRACVPLSLLTSDADPRVRDAAVRALGRLGSPATRTRIEAALSDPDRRVVESAADALSTLDRPASIPALIAALKRVQGKDMRLTDACARALQSISGKGVPADAELWQAWWDTVKERPFAKGDGPGAAGTIEGPRYYGFPVRSDRVVFVLDVSRSMGWNKRLETAKEELAKTIEGLPSSTHFNVVVFGDRSLIWKDRLTRASRSTVQSALRFLRKQAPGNGTNTHSALSKAFREDEVDTIFLLSDGHPSVGLVVDGDLIRTAVKRWNRYRRVRLHAIALTRGDPPPAFAGRENRPKATRFLRLLAEENYGWFKQVE